MQYVSYKDSSSIRDSQVLHTTMETHVDIMVTALLLIRIIDLNIRIFCIYMGTESLSLSQGKLHATGQS